MNRVKTHAEALSLIEEIRAALLRPPPRDGSVSPLDLAVFVPSRATRPVVGIVGLGVDHGLGVGPIMDRLARDVMVLGAMPLPVQPLPVQFRKSIQLTAEQVVEAKREVRPARGAVFQLVVDAVVKSWTDSIFTESANEVNPCDRFVESPIFPGGDPKWLEPEEPFRQE